MDEQAKRNIEELTGRFKGNGKQNPRPASSAFIAFLTQRGPVIVPAIDEVVKAVEQARKISVNCQYGQSPMIGQTQTAGMTCHVSLWTEDQSDYTQCEIRFSASSDEEVVRVSGTHRTRRGLLTKEYQLQAAEITRENVQRIFSRLLNELLLLDG